MAKIKVFGSNGTIVVMSELRYDDIELIKNNAPKELFYYDDNGKITFYIDIAKPGGGRVNDECVIFDDKTPGDDSGRAMVTVRLSGLFSDNENVISTLAENFGGILNKLRVLEQQVSEAVVHVKEGIESAMLDIEILA